MNNTNKTLWFVCFLALFTSFSSFAQDIHYSNFGYSSLNLNPALTGAFDGQYRLNTSYRGQWTSVVDYKTLTLAGDVTTKRFGSWGMHLNYDRSGLSRLDNTTINASYAYPILLSNRTVLRLGGTVGYGFLRFRSSDVRWGDQYDNAAGAFSASATSFDANTFNDRAGHPDFSAGLNLHHQVDAKKRTAFDVGTGVFHLIPIEQHFQNGSKTVLPKRINAYFMGQFELNSKIDLLVQGIAQGQGTYREALIGIGGRLYLHQNMAKTVSLQAGALFRAKDAFALYTGLNYNKWQWGLSFDANYSPFKQATRYWGGFETHVIYTHASAPTKATFCKSCTLFQ